MINHIICNLKKGFSQLRLNRKIQLACLLLIMPLFIFFVSIFSRIYKMNKQYDQIIANTSKAGQFSIKFKEDFDYQIYLLIAGHSSFDDDNPYAKIDEARNIVSSLVSNTNFEENEKRANGVLKLLDNLEKYVRRIEDNKKAGGFYDENIIIWEKDVQIVTNLIQSTVLDYIYYETKTMEQLRVQILKEFKEISISGLAIFVTLIIFEIILSIIIPNSIVKPINHLNYITKQVAKGDLSVRAKISYGAEVKSLSDSLNIMIEKIDYLFTAIKEEEKNLRNAELELLQVQVCPHFLYNTLDTIIWLVENEDKNKVIEMVIALSKFFRVSLNHGDGMCTIREEEQHIQNYLQIQQVRYQDIMKYEINFPETIKKAILPRITLQPLIENALYHGIKNCRRKGKITITGFREGQDVVISVKDNGIGMEEERLGEIAYLLSEEYSEEYKGDDSKSTKKKSYGLYNVNKRIKLKFGCLYGLSISSVYGKGTEIHIRIPFE